MSHNDKPNNTPMAENLSRLLGRPVTHHVVLGGPKYHRSNHTDCTKALIECLGLDLLPALGTSPSVDFGIAGDQRVFGALQWAWNHETASEAELRAACGDGRALTELVQRPNANGKPNPYGLGLRITATLDDEPDRL